jgi:branched-chain amino acid transport system ATP-binding protein
MLAIRGLQVRYGAIAAVRGVDLDINQGEIIALLGANGAGKSTIARSIAGLLPFSGDIVYDGQKLVPNTAEKNLRRGIALVPEGRGILARMTVYENLLMGTYIRADKAEAAGDVARMLERFPILGKRRDGLASLLSGGEQQMLAIARALLSKPKLLLLDEPSLGLAPLMTDTLFKMIAQFRDEGLTVLLVEQKARQTLKIVDRAYLLETGRVVTSGTAQALINDPTVSDAFLGGPHRAHLHLSPLGRGRRVAPGEGKGSGSGESPLTRSPSARDLSPKGRGEEGATPRNAPAPARSRRRCCGRPHDTSHAD